MNSFSYELPEDFTRELVSFFTLNNLGQLATLISRCNITYVDLGYAYYAKVKNAIWDTYALDLTIESDKKTISDLKANCSFLKKWIDKFINTSTTGYVIRNIDYIVRNSEIEIKLPKQNGEDFETLHRDISESLAKNEPELVLDRLHTFSVKFFRNICQKHNIDISTKDGKHYPLHNLVGALVKYYDQNNYFESDFSKKAMKMTISLFESYNDIRNNKSFAHDNVLLNRSEAKYVVRTLADTISFINEIENSH